MDGRAKGKGCASRGLGLITIIRIGPILTSGSIKSNKLGPRKSVPF